MAQHAQFTPQEASEFGRRGGKKSGETRRRKRAIREVCDELLHGVETRKDTLKAVDGIASGKSRKVRRDEILISTLYAAATQDDLGDARIMSAKIKAAELLIGLLQGQDEAVEEYEREASRAEREAAEERERGVGGVIQIPLADMELPEPQAEDGGGK